MPLGVIGNTTAFEAVSIGSSPVGAVIFSKIENSYAVIVQLDRMLVSKTRDMGSNPTAVLICGCNSVGRVSNF